MSSAAALDRARIDEVVTAVCDRLDGDWLLIGGALVALWLEPRRVTEDIDLVTMGRDPGVRHALLGLAGALGLPIEALNSAADFFVERLPGWRGEVELFRSGARGRLYRPTPTLFLLLKMGRLSAPDLADCLAALTRVRAEQLPLDRPRLLAALDALPA